MSNSQFAGLLLALGGIGINIVFAIHMAANDICKEIRRAKEKDGR